MTWHLLVGRHLERLSIRLWRCRWCILSFRVSLTFSSTSRITLVKKKNRQRRRRSKKQERKREVIFFFSACFLPQDEHQEIEMKLARIDITTFETADLFIFRRAVKKHTFNIFQEKENASSPKRITCGTTVSDLPLKPKEMSPFGKLLYKWVCKHTYVMPRHHDS